jgi:acetyl-CoA acetyltransferase
VVQAKGEELTMSAGRAFVIGVGMTAFEKPGTQDWDYPDIGREAAQLALLDAGVPYASVEQAMVGYCYGDSTCGQRAVYEVGLSGIPILNVNNNCATGSSALYLARQAVRSGLSDCVLALGFEKMSKGSLDATYTDRTPPTGRHFRLLKQRWGLERAPLNAQLFGRAGREYAARYGVGREVFATVAAKNHRHSVHNPRAQFREEFSVRDILESPIVFDPLTKLQCCPTSDGGAAAIVASGEFVRRHHLEGQAVEIVGQAMATDLPSSFEGGDLQLVGADMTAAAARAAYVESGLGPEDAQVIELHDCFSTNEVISYEALGLCRPGAGAALAMDGGTTYGGAWVVNPSGGLISKGHPLGATGLAQCAELVWQLRGEAGERQVDGARVGIQHNFGLGGAAVVTIYAKP